MNKTELKAIWKKEEEIAHEDSNKEEIEATNLLNSFENVLNKKDEQKDEDSTFGIAVEISVADGEKCERCWMYSKTVGENAEHPTICHRCSENLE